MCNAHSFINCRKEAINMVRFQLKSIVRIFGAKNARMFIPHNPNNSIRVSFTK